MLSLVNLPSENMALHEPSNDEEEKIGHDRRAMDQHLLVDQEDK